MFVCGEPPFQETNDSETLTMIMDCKYCLPEHLSPELCQYVSFICYIKILSFIYFYVLDYLTFHCSLISHMLVREPSQRVSLENISQHDWLLVPTSLDDLTHLDGSEADPSPLVTKDNISKDDHTHIIQSMIDKKVGTMDTILEYVIFTYIGCTKQHLCC